MDVTLQDLRRRAAATGALEDQAALLRARVRAGELAQDMLELAAYAGDAAARLVVGNAPEWQWVFGDGNVSLAPASAWLIGLERWGANAIAHAAVAAASELMRCLGRGGMPSTDRTAIACMKTARHALRLRGSKRYDIASTALQAGGTAARDVARQACEIVMLSDGSLPENTPRGAHLVTLILATTGTIRNDERARAAIRAALVAVRDAIATYALGAPRA